MDNYHDQGNGLLFCRECHVSILAGSQREHERNARPYHHNIDPARVTPTGGLYHVTGIQETK